MRPHVIALVVTEGLPVLELAAPCEIFGLDRSDLANPWYELRICSVDRVPVRSIAGVRVDAGYGMRDVATADTVLVAACAPPISMTPPQAILEALREAKRNGARIASISTGAYLLAAAGLLDGRRVTTHWMEADDFARRWPGVTVDPGVLYIDDGEILTSAGTAAAIDLCLHLVRLDHGAGVANEVGRRMVVPPCREGDQSQHRRSMAKPPRNLELGSMLDWALRHLDQPLTVDDLARHAQLSSRSLTRKFLEVLGTTPLQWLIQQRVRLAQELLETSDAPIEWIAKRSGFGTTTNFRNHFHRATGVSPQAYRHTFWHEHPEAHPVTGAPHYRLRRPYAPHQVAAGAGHDGLMRRNSVDQRA
jgi:transcriptional regulator GlxA family with amidase domain